jgi:hypothetical protein
MCNSGEQIVSEQGPEHKQIVVGPFTLYKRYSFTMPKGTISEVGREIIKDYIRMAAPSREENWQKLNPGTDIFDLKRLPENWQWVWSVTQKGSEYGVGKFPTRVAKFYKETMKLKCPPEFLEKLGTFARDHSSDPQTYHFEIVNEIDWDRGDFGDPVSCWWTDYSAARKTLTDGGGLAIRFYESAQGNRGIARAWLAPTQDMWVLFNGYGFSGDSRLVIVRMLTEYLGVSYKKVSLENHNNLMYINDDRGYLLGYHDVVKDITHVSLKIGPVRVYCHKCGNSHYEHESIIDAQGNHMCRRCYDRMWGTCPGCAEQGCSPRYNRQDMVNVVGIGVFCVDCAPDHGKPCLHCNDYYQNHSLTEIHGHQVCGY